MSNIDGNKVLVRFGTAVLYLEAGILRFNISDDAKEMFERRLSEFIAAPHEQIIERRETKAKGRFVDGVAKVAIMACQIAKEAGRTSVTSADIEESIKRNYCSSWPFCK